jgi:hypothetical protein
MMNQRIEEFAKQCYVKTGSPHTDHFEYWKFAELIVQECCNEAAHLSNMNPDIDFKTGALAVCELLRMRFEVK